VRPKTNTSVNSHIPPLFSNVPPKENYTVLDLEMIVTKMIPRMTPSPVTDTGRKKYLSRTADKLILDLFVKTGFVAGYMTTIQPGGG
jgi:hypothetical protein